MEEGKLRGVDEMRLARSRYLLSWAAGTWGVVMLFYFCIHLENDQNKLFKSCTR